MNRTTIENLIAQYNNENLISFFHARSREFARRNHTFQNLADENFGSPVYIGDITLLSDSNLAIWSIPVKSDLSKRQGKRSQYDFSINLLKINNAFHGLFVYHDEAGNFRFSYVYRIPEGTRTRGSDYKRFTFYVSLTLTNKTFIQRFIDETFDDHTSIMNAFSVEPVSSQFFNQFRDVFQATREAFVTKNANTICRYLKSRYEAQDQYDEQINKYIFTFLGRIIFLYFMLRKGWVEGRNDYIRSIRYNLAQVNLYQSLFEPLFFEVFAKDPQQRSAEIQERFPNTPYLNGGLFERNELEIELLENNYIVIFEDSFLRETIIDFFESYNFTVDENLADDQEVSIDPEMLGKGFENSLAETQRKRTGTFYTPREIVHYMVLNSIKQYLCNETNINEEKINEFVFDQQNNTDSFSISDLRVLDQKLRDVKVLDPAVGSGAFPVDFLNTLVKMRKALNVGIGRNINEVSIKKRFIKDNLYGVDIDPSAIEITKLRLWLSLIVDYDLQEAEPLPSLDFQFRIGNSLMEKIAGIDIFQDQIATTQDWTQDSRFSIIKEKMLALKNEFYTSTDEVRKHKIRQKFDELEKELLLAVLDDYEKSFIVQRTAASNDRTARFRRQSEITARKIENLHKMIHQGTYKLFKPDFHFAEVYDRFLDNGERANGFDIVIGNPPYGVSIDREIQDDHGLGSKDSYGVFISTALKRFLKENGVLEFIVSDTWLSIKTHKLLREQVLSNQIHHVILLHADCFDAVVNVNILSLSNRQPDESKSMIAADLSNISTRSEVDTLHVILYQLSDYIGVSTVDYAVYTYPQNLIFINANKPIFVGSPKLFRLTQDVGCDTVTKLIGGEEVQTRLIEFNSKTLEIVRFGDIADVKQGLATGDNWAYLFQNPEAHGTYRNINDFKQFLLSEDELETIAQNEDIRLKIIEYGFHKSMEEPDFDLDRWFNGKYIVPYDKGGESDTSSGWLPNYYVPTNYFIDWSSWAVNRLKSLTQFDRDGKGSKSKLVSRFQNIEYYFRKGFTFSITGIYAPTFRVGSNAVFDVKGSYIVPHLTGKGVLGLISSRFVKYVSKVYIYNAIDTQVDAIKDLPFFVTTQTLNNLVESIIAKQHTNPSYPYHLYEQKEIDRIVYQLFNLNEEDILEVETWYRRRYPALRESTDT